MLAGFEFFVLVFGVPIVLLAMLGSGGSPSERSDEDY